MSYLHPDYNYGYAVKVHTYLQDDIFRLYDGLIFDWDRMDGKSNRCLDDKSYVGWIDVVISSPGGYGPNLQVRQHIEHKSNRISACWWEFPPGDK